MNRLKTVLPLVALMVISLLSCNKSSNEEEEAITYTNTAVTSFSLKNNDDVLPKLNTVFFSIDLNTARIFNADSLPKGTDVSALAVNIGTGVLQKADLVFKDKNGETQTVSYLADNEVLVNFANGPVMLNVTSYDGTTSRSYEIKVNVHKQDADLLVWDDASKAPLPTTLSAVTQSKAVDFGGYPAVLTVDGASGACLALCSNVEEAVWEYAEPTLPQGADVSSFTAVNSTLYIIASGELWSSSDGLTWTSTSQPMTYIYGSYEDTVVGNVKGSDGKYRHVTYPGSVGDEVDAQMPVAGTSTMVSYTNEWMTAPQSTMVGGVTASGTATGAAWAYDGTNWVMLNTEAVPAGVGATLVPYYVFRKSSTSWQHTKLAALLAFGELTADGVSDTVYVSTDYGLHWVKAADALQLPADMPKAYGRQGLVFSTTMYADQTLPMSWSEARGTQLPEWMMASAVMADATEGATPIEQWECPYIYLYGGMAADGKLNNTMWRGVIRRLTYKPLQ